jgi:predicted negative regulator of RcsB-dependent stress response
MNRYLKGCLIFWLVIALLVAGIAGWYYWEKINKHKQADADLVTYNKVCDTLNLITEKPFIGL